MSSADFVNGGRTPTVTLCYEAGYDGFWLSRFPEQRGIGCLVMEPASLRVNRRARKLAIALWRYLETGLIPDGARLKANQS